MDGKAYIGREAFSEAIVEEKARMNKELFVISSRLAARSILVERNPRGRRCGIRLS